MRELREAFDHGVEDLVRAEAGGVLEARLDDQREVPVAALQAGDHVAAAERDRQEVGGHLGDVLGGGQPLRRGRAELEHADQAVPEHDGRQDDAGEAPCREESRVAVSGSICGAPASAGDHHGCAAGHRLRRRRVVAQAPRLAAVDRVAADVAGGERRSATAPSTR